MASRPVAQPTPASWKTPYELYEERRSVSTSSAAPIGTAATASSYTTNSASAHSGASSSAALADTVNVRGIAIAGWRIETHRGSIADSKTIEELSDAWRIPMPEMPFDKNRLVIRYEGRGADAQRATSVPSPSEAGWLYCFDGMRALRAVEGVSDTAALQGLEMSGDGSATSRGGSTKTKPTVGLGQKPTKRKRVQVAYANEWGKKRDQQQAAGMMPASSSGGAGPTSHFGPDVALAAANGTIASARDYDWTYSCTWPGCEDGEAAQHFVPAQDPARDRIPLERLAPPPTPGAKAEPILFFDDLILFEDELGDNGTSMLNVKVRVMPTGLLVLQRFFLRVDDVVFRVFDTRMYVSFFADDESRVTSATAARPTTTAASANTARSASSAATATAHLARLSLGNPRRQQEASTIAPASVTGGATLACPFRVIRECAGYQERYVDVRARLPAYKANDLSPLTDPGWVAQQLTKMAEERQRKQWATSQAAGLHPGTMVSAQHADPTQPAVLPSTAVRGHESNRILGDVSDQSANNDELWEGEGHRIDVALLY